MAFPIVRKPHGMTADLVQGWAISYLGNARSRGVSAVIG
jgi:hypothetical protein